MRTALYSIACALGIAALAPADVLILKDGRVFKDHPMKHTEAGVTIAFENGEVLVREELIQDAIIVNDRPFVPQTNEEREKVDKGFVRYEGKWVTPARRESLIDDRLKEYDERLQEMLETRQWRSRRMESTKHFDFEATVPKHIFEDYRDLMETYFTSFLKEWKLKQPRDLGRLKVCFYIDRDNYLQVTGQSPYVLGYFRFVPPLELNIYYDRLDPGGTEDVMFHEANHYLQKLIDPGFSYPHFPGESLAEYYGASSWDPDKKELTTGLVQEGRLTEVLEDISRDEWVGLEKLLRGEAGYEDYTWGWSLVHFLMNDKKLGPKFRKWYVALAKGKDVDRTKGGWNLDTVAGDEMLRSFKDYLGLRSDDDLKELEQDWYEYIQEVLRIQSVRGLEVAAWNAYRSGKPLRAKRLFGEALDKGTDQALTFYRYANLLDSADEEEDKRFEYWRTAIELDPLTADFYIRLGMELTGKDDEADKEEGKRLLKLALEIEPENYWLERNLDTYLER